MQSSYQYPKFEYRRPPELEPRPPGTAASGMVTTRHRVLVIGAGPVGLAAAIDLAVHGAAPLVLDEDDTVSVGSRGLCYAKRTIEILDRLGVGDPVVDKGVTWNTGRTFFRDEEVYRFNLLPDPDHRRPGMINLQQYYLEEYLVDRARALGIEMRWKHRVVAVEPGPDGVRVEVETPDGSYRLEADWLVVADGARSPVRRMLGLDIEGKVFMDRFLIADVVMKADFPPERWFWFDPPFHPGQSVLLHRQADNLWRIDFQLGWDADPEEEKKPEKVIPRIRAMLGEEHEFTLDWVSVYTFQCRRMGEFRHGRVLFVGDAAHQVSPFGARGANSGIQDVDNLVWKLALVLEGRAPEALLDSYSLERAEAADENIMNSTRSTDFITPKSATSRTFRNAVLGLARRHPFARALVNSGRLSVPSFLTDSPLNTPDEDAFEGRMLPGAPVDDAPVRIEGADRWLLDVLGDRFQLLVFTDDASGLDVAALGAMDRLPVPVEPVLVTSRDERVSGARALHDHRGLVAARFDARNGTVVLLRPDQHVAARWRAFDPERVAAAVRRATCRA